jgi:hypothetical protein
VLVAFFLLLLQFFFNSIKGEPNTVLCRWWCGDGDGGDDDNYITITLKKRKERKREGEKKTCYLV